MRIYEEGKEGSENKERRRGSGEWLPKPLCVCLTSLIRKVVNM